MGLYLKIILVLFGLAYLISPVDIIPDLLLPYVGWIDDGVVIWTIIHLIRYGELPWFFFKKKAKKNRVGREQNPPGNTGKTQKNRGEQNNESCSLKSAHEILGISANATLREIHTAYKEKIKQYHPDKVSHLGDEFSDLANEKFLEIQNAYEVMKTRHRG